MADDWTTPLTGNPGDPLPPLADPEDSDPNSDDWYKAIYEETLVRKRPHPSTKSSTYEVRATTTVTKLVVPVSGAKPGPWERIGRKDVGDKDYILWQRIYPSVTFQRWDVLKVTWQLITRDAITALEAGKIRKTEDLPPPRIYWIKKGKPHTHADVKFYKWEESSVHHTDADGTKSYVEVTTPPNDDPKSPYAPTPDGKFGDPKEELRTARVEFRDDGVLVALGVVVRDAEGRPLDGVSVTVEGELAGVTAANGGLELTRFFARPPEDFSRPPRAVGTRAEEGGTGGGGRQRGAGSAAKNPRRRGGRS
jgi:hypothetical protein